MDITLEPGTVCVMNQSSENYLVVPKGTEKIILVEVVSMSRKEKLTEDDEDLTNAERDEIYHLITQGHEDGLNGEDYCCPYVEGTPKGRAYYDAYREGKAKRLSANS